MFDPSKFTISKPKPLPVVFLIDVSGSMGEIIDDRNVVDTGQTIFDDGKEYHLVSGGISRIQVVNDCCSKMINNFADLEKLETEIDVAIITFGATVNVHQALTSASKILWTKMEAHGETPLGNALEVAKSMLEDRNEVPGRAYRPTVILVSDGRPDPGWEIPLRSFISEGRSSKCDRMALGIGDDADKEVLGKFIEGTGRNVFSAADADTIQTFFSYITMSVTNRTLSNNPNEINIQSSIEEKPRSIQRFTPTEEESYF